MPGKRTCFQCGKERTDDSLSGLCPNCLALQAFSEMDEGTNTIAPAGNAAPKRRVAPDSDFELRHARVMIGCYQLLEQIGGALLRQKKYTEVEPLLLSGYLGMRERADQIPAGVRQTQLKETRERLLQVYRTPGQTGKVAGLKKQLDELNPPASL